MILGCVLPLLFIFFAPALGLGGNTSIFIFIIAMFTIHLLIPHHSGHGHSQESNDSDTKKQNHEQLQH